MRIEQLYLKNFRNVEEQTYALNPHFTVFIGINGRGKSTWLHALRVACGAFLLAIPEAKKRHIDQDDIRQSDGHFSRKHTPVIVEATGRMESDAESIVWRRRVVGGSSFVTTTSNEDVGAIRDIGKKKYAQMQAGSDNLNLPLLAFFGTSRVHGAGRNHKTRTIREIFKEGYANWFEMRSATYRYDAWLMTYDVLHKEGKEYDHLKEVFFSTLRLANPYIQKLEFIGTELWLQIALDDYSSDFLPIHLHSDGVVSFTELVAELAYRCIVLNGNLGKKAVEKTTGVVMIDELDLHLHPNWQRHVVADLKKAFPSLQFVATTHSPYIVQSLAASELINLDRISDVKPSDLSLNEVSVNVMGVEHDFSALNANQESQSNDYLQLLESMTQGDLPAIADKLNGIEKQISDPAVRAFLQMHRLTKQTNQ
jgi:predicted ATP-binding protein involved in virulence